MSKIRSPGTLTRRIALHAYHLLLLGSIIWLGQTAMVVPFQPVCSAEKGVGTGDAIRIDGPLELKFVSSMGAGLDDVGIPWIYDVRKSQIYVSLPNWWDTDFLTKATDNAALRFMDETTGSHRAAQFDVEGAPGFWHSQLTCGGLRAMALEGRLPRPDEVWPREDVE